MELRARIIEEATRMFSEQGIKSVRMDDIAAGCGISKRTLYEIFADREELIRQTLHHKLEKLGEAIVAKTAGVENVLEEFWISLHYGTEFKKHNALMMADLLKFYPQLLGDFMEENMRHALLHNEQQLQKGIDQGWIISYMDREKMATLIAAHFYGLRKDLFSNEFDPLRNNMDSSTIKTIVVLFLRGIATEKGRRYIDDHILPTLR